MSDKVTIFTIENQEYLVLDSIKYQDKTYLFLVNMNNDKDILIQEYKSEFANETFGVSKDILDVLLELFLEKHKKEE